MRTARPWLKDESWPRVIVGMLLMLTLCSEIFIILVLADAWINH